MKGFNNKNIGIVDVNLGKNVTIIEPSNIYGCTLGDDVFIGPFVEVQKHVFIGDKTKIQSHTFVCELVNIGKNCFIGHGVVFINDKFSDGAPAMGNKEKWKATSIGNNVSIGSNSSIMPVNICNDVAQGL